MAVGRWPIGPTLRSSTRPAVLGRSRSARPISWAAAAFAEFAEELPPLVDAQLRLQVQPLQLGFHFRLAACRAAFAAGRSYSLSLAKNRSRSSGPSFRLDRFVNPFRQLAPSPARAANEASLFQCSFASRLNLLEQPVDRGFAVSSFCSDSRHDEQRRSHVRRHPCCRCDRASALPAFSRAARPSFPSPARRSHAAASFSSSGDRCRPLARLRVDHFSNRRPLAGRPADLRKSSRNCSCSPARVRATAIGRRRPASFATAAASGARLMSFASCRRRSFSSGFCRSSSNARDRSANSAFCSADSELTHSRRSSSDAAVGVREIGQASRSNAGSSFTTSFSEIGRRQLPQEIDIRHVRAAR